MNNKIDPENIENFWNSSSSPSCFLGLAQEACIYSFWEWDILKDCIRITERTAKVLGTEPGSLSRGEFEKLLSPDETESVKSKIDEAFKKNDPFSLEIKFRGPGKANRWISLRGKPYFEDKKAIKVIGLISDITELKLRTMELEEAALRANRTQAIAHLGSWEYKSADGALIWSDETYRIFGKTPERFTPTYETYLDNIYPEDRDKVSKAYEQSINNKEYGYENKHRIINEITGETRWVHEKCFHRWDINGEFIGSSGMILDITEKELLTRKYENFYQAIENASNAIIITNPKGQITYSNPAFNTLYGYSFEEIRGKNPKILNPGIANYIDYGFKKEVYSSIFSSMWKDIKDPEKGHWDGELLNRTKSGEILRVHLYVNTAKNEAGEITSIIGYPIDISSQYSKEKEIRFQTIMAIADLAEARDNETGQHMKRIGSYAYFIAREMGLTTKFCNDIKVFAPLHDIGKVGISDSILLAERKLSDEEFEIMKTHTTIGYDILKDRPLMEMAAEIAHCHTGEI